MQTIQEKNRFKKKALVRTKTAFLLIALYILFMLFNILASDVWFKNILSRWQNFIFSIGCLCILTPIIIFSCKEIVNLSFVHKKIALFSCAMIVIMATWGLGLFYTINRYFILPTYIDNNTKYLQRIFFINIILNIFYAFGLFVGSAIVVYVCRKKSEILMFQQSVLWFPVLMLLVGLFFPTLFCVSINYQWTTFILLIGMSNLFDVLAYFGGSLWGKIKLIPKVSPKKTIEGLIFSIFATLFVVISIYVVFIYTNNQALNSYQIIYTFFGSQFGAPNDVGKCWWWIIAIIFSLVILFVSGVGDLFFSFIKRQYKIKDFSNLLPGHGGALDRLDAISFVFAFYYFFSTGIIAIIPDNFKHIEFFWTGIFK